MVNEGDGWLEGRGSRSERGLENRLWSWMDPGCDDIHMEFTIPMDGGLAFLCQNFYDIQVL
jgi:hypothetical protein